MQDDCTTCAHAQKLRDNLEALRLQYNQLAEAYRKLDALFRLEERALEFTQELYRNARDRMFDEAEQYATMPEHLALPLIKQHGFELCLARWPATDRAIRKRHESLVRDLQEITQSNITPNNIVPFPTPAE